MSDRNIINIKRRNITDQATVLLTVPCWNLVTTEDRAFLPKAQKAMAQAARDAGADVWSEEIVASHSPMLSRPAETVGFLRRAVVAFEEKAL